MEITCRFDGGDVGLVSAESAATSDTPVPFMPYRSLAHMRLGEALARDHIAVVELHGPGIEETRRVTAMTVRSITFAHRDSA